MCLITANISVFFQSWLFFCNKDVQFSMKDWAQWLKLLARLGDFESVAANICDYHSSLESLESLDLHFVQTRGSWILQNFHCAIDWQQIGLGSLFSNFPCKVAGMVWFPSSEIFGNQGLSWCMGCGASSKEKYAAGSLRCVWKLACFFGAAKRYRDQQLQSGQWIILIVFFHVQWWVWIAMLKLQRERNCMFYENSKRAPGTYSRPSICLWRQSFHICILGYLRNVPLPCWNLLRKFSVLSSKWSEEDEDSRQGAIRVLQREYDAPRPRKVEI